MKIATSILNLSKTKENLKKIDETTTDMIHLDIMDNNFVNNYSDLYDFVLSYEVTKPLDVHLMVSSPREYIEKYSKLNPTYITIHVEINENIEELINLIHSKNIKVGLAIDLNTPIYKVEKYLNKIDLLLIMSVKAGYGGQTFTDISDKLKEARIYQKDNNFLIEVDGGINDENISTIDSDIVVVGNYITKSDNYQEQIDKLRN